MTNKHLTIILEEMFNRVGKKYSPKFTQKVDWFLKYSWTEEEQEDFVKWVTNYLYNSKDARHELMSVPIRNKNYCENVARFFALDFGWRLK